MYIIIYPRHDLWDCYICRSGQGWCQGGQWGGIYTGQKKVALLDVEIHDNPIPLESYTMRQGKVWAVICHPGKPFIINLKECDN